MKKKINRRKTARIYYAGKNGERLYWTVKLAMATAAVTVTGRLLDAIRGKRGTTIGCSMSNCCEHNTEAFPHPVLFASFTRSTCLVVTKVTNGAPSHAVKYQHSYARIVEMNDREKTKRWIRDNPDLMEREFTLRPPRPYRGEPRDRTPTFKSGYRKRAFVPKGALRRAIDAGLVSPGLATVGFK